MLWANKFLPSLLPFFIGAELLEKTGAFSMGASFFEKPCRAVFKCPGEALGVVLLSYAAGFPTGARVIGGLYNEGVFTEKQAERLSIWGATTSPRLCGRRGWGGHARQRQGRLASARVPRARRGGQRSPFTIKRQTGAQPL